MAYLEIGMPHFGGEMAYLQIDMPHFGREMVDLKMRMPPFGSAIGHLKIEMSQKPPSMPHPKTLGFRSVIATRDFRNGGWPGAVSSPRRAALGMRVGNFPSLTPAR
jgi:hypothetical protein